MNVSVYDDVDVEDRVVEGRGIRGVLTDGASRWELHADVVIDADGLPGSLSEAIAAGAESALDAISALVGKPR